MLPTRIAGVFVDRDGVLNKHLPGEYVQTPEELIVLPGVAQAIRLLNEAGIPVIVISNQQGVGKGLMTDADLQAIEDALASEIARETQARISAWYYCTDLKSAGSNRRKPEPGMLIEAAHDFGLTLAETVFLGDSATDIAAGHAAGVGGTVLLLSGAIHHYTLGDMTPEPDLISPDLNQAIEMLLRNCVSSTAP